MGMSWFDYESGHAWCESAYKYQTLPYVAEFANTVTNLPIIVLPLVNAMLLRRYIQDVNAGVVVPNLLLSFNGIASTYYHATLNLFGQLVDELSLVWIVTMFLVVYVPVMEWYPQKYGDKMHSFRLAIFALTAILSLLCFIEPNLNALCLMGFTIPSVVVIKHEGTKAKMPEIASFPRRVFLLWGAATALWISDRVMCPVWLALGTPYCHALFHLLSSVAGYTVFVMFSLIDIQRRRERGEHKFTAKLSYFPDNGNQSIFSLPYVSLQEEGKSF